MNVNQRSSPGCQAPAEASTSVYLRLRGRRRRRSRKSPEPGHQLVCVLHDREATPMRSQHYFCLNKAWTMTPGDVSPQREKNLARQLMTTEQEGESAFLRDGPPPQTGPIPSSQPQTHTCEQHEMYSSGFWTSTRCVSQLLLQVLDLPSLSNNRA